VREGRRIAILGFGTLTQAALAAGDALNATVVDMRFVKPLDADLLSELVKTHDAFVTVEEGAIMGGAGSAVTEFFGSQGVLRPVLQLGLPDKFIDHGDQATLLKYHGLDAFGIEKSIRQRFTEMFFVQDKVVSR
jgi:1-deoxy-D-xylulose-5-phosphate synthase